MSLTDPIQQQLTWGNRYLKQKTPFGCIFTQKTKQQNIITASALLKKHLKGITETSLQYFCFQEVVMEDRKPHNHHCAPIFINSERSCAGQEGPSSTSSPDLGSAGHYSPATCGSQRGLPAFQNSPSPSQSSKTSVQAFLSPFQAIPTSSRTLGSSLATGDILEGN